jgi:hypothetical protein
LLKSDGGKTEQMSGDRFGVMMRTLDSENKLTERADQKAISLLSILGVFMVFFVIYCRVIPINYFTVSLMIIYLVCAILSIGNLIMTIRPRIKKEEGASSKDAPTCDPAFFGGICQFANYAEYRQAFENMISSEENIINVYSHQVYTIARINSSKYKYLQRGMLFVVISLAVELLVVGYLFQHYMGIGITL